MDLNKLFNERKEELTAKLYKKVGARLKLFRELLKKNRQEFAADLKTTPYRLRKIENGESYLEVEMLKELRFQYAVSYDWLYHGTGLICSGTAPGLPAVLPSIDAYAKYSGTKNMDEFVDFLMLLELPASREYVMAMIDEARSRFRQDLKAVRKEKITGLLHAGALSEVLERKSV